MQAGKETNFGLGVQGLSERYGGALASTTLLTAQPASKRAPSMAMVVQPSGSGSPDLWVWDSASTETADAINILEADDAPTTGRWKRQTLSVGEIANGAVTPAKFSLPVRNETGVAFVEGDLVYVSGWSEAESRFLVSKADADAANAVASFVMQGALANNTNGSAYKTHRLVGVVTTAEVDTSGTSVGDAIYLNTTAGGWTKTLPTAPTSDVQVVGRVAVVSATIGEIEFDLVSNNVNLIGRARIQPQAVSPSLLSFTLAAETGSTAVVLDHADASPAELLAANANVDRIVLVRGVATEDAAGEPDIDVGSETTDTNGIVDDAFAGAWVEGDEFSGTILLPAGEALHATIAAAGTAGAFDVFVDAIVIPKPVTELVAGQDETSDTTIPVTGIAVGDEVVEVLVFTPGTPAFAQRALTDFTIGAGEITVGANAANNTGNQYHIRWIDKT